MPIPGLTSLAIPYGSTIVISGATGFIGSHVVDQALAAGFKVRGTTRSVDKAAWCPKYFKGKYGDDAFELFQVEDQSSEGAFDKPVAGQSVSLSFLPFLYFLVKTSLLNYCSVAGAKGFIHVAHDMSGPKDPSKAIPYAIAGALSAAKSAYRAGIRRMVYTSSSFAVTQPKPDEEFTLTVNTYNEEAVKKCQTGSPSGEDVYCAAKVGTERALTKWAREEAKDFVINMINPNGNIGPMISAKDQGYPTSARFVERIYLRDYDTMKSVPPQWYIDVQDDAKLHLIALVSPNVQGERVFGTTGPFNMQDIVECLRKIYPDQKWDDFPDKRKDLSYFEPTVRAEELLKEAYGHGYTNLLESVRGNAKDLK
ncbi:hypothetical protein IAT38_001293 [Cryptococcus sp. DSM 104549]